MKAPPLNTVAQFFQRRIVRQRNKTDSQSATSTGAQTRERIVRRAAAEFKDGMYGIHGNSLMGWGGEGKGEVLSLSAAPGDSVHLQS